MQVFNPPSGFSIQSHPSRRSVAYGAVGSLPLASVSGSSADNVNALLMEQMSATSRLNAHGLTTVAKTSSAQRLRFGQGSDEGPEIDWNRFSPTFAQITNNAVMKAMSNEAFFVTPEMVLLEALDYPGAKNRLEAQLRNWQIPVQSFKEGLTATVERQIRSGQLNGRKAEGLEPLAHITYKNILETIPPGVTIDETSFLRAALFTASAPLYADLQRYSDRRDLRQTVLEQETMEGDPPEPPLLDVVTEDMTFEARDKRRPPIVGREDKVRTVLEILQQRQKSLPLLVGEPGVGKTAVAEAVASLLAEGNPADGSKKNIPDELLMRDTEGNRVTLPNGNYRGKKLLKLNWSRLEGLSKNPIKVDSALLDQLAQELMARKDEAILWFDEFHRVAANGDALKEAMSREDLKVMGATTSEEKRKYIDADGALDRRVSAVPIEAMSAEKALTTLRGSREYLEQKYGFGIEDGALKAFVKLGKEHLSVALPDAAFTLLDRSCGRKKIALELGHPAVAEARANLNDVAINLAAEDGPNRAEIAARLKAAETAFDKSLEELTTDIKISGANGTLPTFTQDSWKQAIQESEQQHASRNEFQALKAVLATLVKNQPVADTDPLAQGLLPLMSVGSENQTPYRSKVLRLQLLWDNVADASKQMDLLLNDVQLLQQKRLELEKVLITPPKVTPQLTETDVYETLASQYGMSVRALAQSDRERLLDLENALDKRVVGQNRAKSEIVGALRRHQSGMVMSPNKPIGSFLLLGPTGVGKTEVVKSLAEAYYGSEDAIIRFDMSEFMQPHMVSRLIGSPQGYVGYDDGGELINKMLENPNRVILFDEVEKANPAVFDLLLQILDDGRLTSANGKRTVSFNKNLIVMTSNIGGKRIEKKLNAAGGFELDPTKRSFGHLESDINTLAYDALKRSGMFRPETLNRMDGVIACHPLTRKHIEQVVEIQLQRLNKMLATHPSRISVSLTPDAKEYLIEQGSDFAMGARPINRFINHTIVTELSNLHLTGKLRPGQAVEVDRDMLMQWHQKDSQGS
ncbi:MAG: ATP-dependent Clp protease ATP-binding subunit [Candidatus Melainabacteria bacterium]|nr:ATP-dependent Clp protease ATP-binding subunit [Candidatus Melainabacteria bacterium]